MKKLILILFTLSILSACGGGSNPGVDPSANNNLNAPVILSIAGNGSSSDQFQNGLIVIGKNFTSDMRATLSSIASGKDFETTPHFNSSTQLTIDLPSTIIPGDYRLVLADTSGTASSNVTILQGEKGPQGPPGSVGKDGITMQAQFVCGASNDLGSGNIKVFASLMDISKFSDNIYFASCISNYQNLTIGFVDTASNSLWFAGNSQAVQSGVISCNPYYVKGDYSITNNSVTYTNLLDPTKKQTIACQKVYP